MIFKAADTLIAWNANDGPGLNAPGGSVAVGPMLVAGEPDWCRGYEATGGAAYTVRRALKKREQLLHVMLDWYQLVYMYGIHPYIAHRAFLHIDEYQEALKWSGMGPDKGELGHDRESGYGRAVDAPLPEIIVQQAGRSFHYWPVNQE